MENYDTSCVWVTVIQPRTRSRWPCISSLYLIFRRVPFHAQRPDNRCVNMLVCTRVTASYPVTDFYWKLRKFRNIYVFYLGGAVLTVALYERLCQSLVHQARNSLSICRSDECFDQKLQRSTKHVLCSMVALRGDLGVLVGFWGNLRFVVDRRNLDAAFPVDKNSVFKYEMNCSLQGVSFTRPLPRKCSHTWKHVRT